MQDPSFLTKDQTDDPLQWKHRVPTTGPAGNSGHVLLSATYHGRGAGSGLLLFSCAFEARTVLVLKESKQVLSFLKVFL